MKLLSITVLFLFFAMVSDGQQADSVFIRKIYDEALVNGKSYENLRYLCKEIGPRLSGSDNARKAVEWTKRLMENYKFDRVYLQEVTVPHWERGPRETAKILVGNRSIPVPVAALGGSVATGDQGITADVVEVRQIDELAALGEAKIKGKIVFFNRAFDSKPIDAGISYGTAVDQRVYGPSAAAKFGAVGVIVRSMTHAVDDLPHTGSTVYEQGIAKIPAAAISTKAANDLSDLLKEARGRSVKFYLKQSCKTLPDAVSYNVIGELKGSEAPGEIITVGGHLDSWDLAEGAHDDGTGVMQAVEVLRIFKSLNYRPKHTIRAVLFMNEENGNRGGKKYAELAARNHEKHIAAVESDEGGFTPRGFSINASPDKVRSMANAWKDFFTPYLSDHFVAGGSGTDITPLGEAVPGVVLVSFVPDTQRYFDIHHTPNDVFENVNKRELELGGASIAALLYLIDKWGVPQT